MMIVYLLVRKGSDLLISQIAGIKFHAQSCSWRYTKKTCTIDKRCKHGELVFVVVIKLAFSLVSLIESLENGQCKRRRKFNLEQLKFLVGGATNHFNELQK